MEQCPHHPYRAVLGSIEASGIDEKTASLDEALVFCIEMETGTGEDYSVFKTRANGVSHA